MKDLDQLYLEHQTKIKENLSNIKHIDLWSEQVSFLMEEQPFKAPAVFIAYRALQIDDIGDQSQKIRMGVDLYYYYETFAATHYKSKKQQKALSFLEEITNIHKLFHGTNGANYSNMKRIGFAPVETGTANLLYVQKFECTVIDDSATAILQQAPVANISVVNEEIERTGSQEEEQEEKIYPEIETN